MLEKCQIHLYVFSVRTLINQRGYKYDSYAIDVYSVETIKIKINEMYFYKLKERNPYLR